MIFTRGTSTTAISSSLPSEAGHGGSDGPYFPGNACLIPVWVRSSCCLRPVGDPIHHQLGRPDPPPGRRRVAMAVAATTRPLCRVSVDASFIGQAMCGSTVRG